MCVHVDVLPILFLDWGAITVSLSTNQKKKKKKKEEKKGYTNQCQQQCFLCLFLSLESVLALISKVITTFTVIIIISLVLSIHFLS